MLSNDDMFRQCAEAFGIPCGAVVTQQVIDAVVARAAKQSERLEYLKSEVARVSAAIDEIEVRRECP